LLAEGIDELKAPDEEKRGLSMRVQALRREADRLKGILQDFLEFAGQVRLAPQPADMNAVIVELTDFFRPEAERQGVRIMQDLEPSGTPASFDVKLIKQAMLNLLLNAVQAMAGAKAGSTRSAGDNGPVGELILRTRRGVEDGRQEVVRAHVIDTGPG